MVNFGLWVDKGGRGGYFIISHVGPRMKLAFENDDSGE